jgi:diacylglycerol kinase family enzyme
VLNHLNFFGFGSRRAIVPDDGKLDIFVMRHTTFFGLLRVAFDFYFGVGNSTYLRHVAAGSARCTLEKFSGTMHLDGDPIFDTFTELEFRTLHKRASLIR